MTDISVVLEVQEGIITDGLDSLDRIGFVATMPTMLSSATMTQLSQKYPGISGIQVEEGLQLAVLDESVFSVNYLEPATLETLQPPSAATQTLVAFDGSALDGMKLLADLGFTEINIDPQAIPGTSFTATGSASQYVGELLHIKLRQVNNSPTISINGIPATGLTQGTSISELSASLSPLDVISLLVP